MHLINVIHRRGTGNCYLRGGGGGIYGDTYNSMYFSFTRRWVNNWGFISGGVGEGGL